jgi:hypothetical protein
LGTQYLIKGCAHHHQQGHSLLLVLLLLLLVLVLVLQVLMSPIGKVLHLPLQHLLLQMMVAPVAAAPAALQILVGRLPLLPRHLQCLHLKQCLKCLPAEAMMVTPAENLLPVEWTPLIVVLLAAAAASAAAA